MQWYRCCWCTCASGYSVYRLLADTYTSVSRIQHKYIYRGIELVSVVLVCYTSINSFATVYIWHAAHCVAYMHKHTQQLQELITTALEAIAVVPSKKIVTFGWHMYDQALAVRVKVDVMCPTHPVYCHNDDNDCEFHCQCCTAHLPTFKHAL
jgi:hypothetical protein